MIPTVKRNERFCYLGRYYNFAMDNSDHKGLLFEETEEILGKIDRLALHPKFKLQLYMKYLLPKISWHLTIADIDKTWVRQTLDMMCHNKFRAWLEIPPCGTLDILLLAKSKFGLNIIDISVKFTQYQVVLRSKLKNQVHLTFGQCTRPVVQILMFSTIVFSSRKKLFKKSWQKKLQTSHII